MHEPLPRAFRTGDAPSAALELLRACTLAVIVAVACVGAVSIAGELRALAPAAGASTQTSGSAIALAARAAASSTDDLSSGMPQP
jgi:hypothetical protein